MKILFLDIDGVCNSEKSFAAHGNEIFGIDPYMAFLVGKIVLDTQCEVVLSSSWRHSQEGVALIEKRVTLLLDKTAQSESGFRGNEVADWVNQHPEVTRYAILDDDSDFHSDQPLFQTSWQEGLTEEIARKVTDYLNETE